MAGDPWKEGPLGDAFDVDSNTNNVKSAGSNNPPASDKISSSKTPPKPGASTNQNFEGEKNSSTRSKDADVDSEYPAETKGEAIESLKRAANIEDYNNFEKVASAIENKHPDALNDFEELEKVSYIVGRNMAEGIYDELQDKT